MPPAAPPQWSADAAGLPVLRLADVLKEPELGSPDLPTVGSAGHRVGRCKPCAFVWKEGGCSNGTDCPFCHLCGPSERRNRKKERKAQWQKVSVLDRGMQARHMSSMWGGA